MKHTKETSRISLGFLKDFCLAGRATVVVRNSKTNNERMYYLHGMSDSKKPPFGLYVVFETVEGEHVRLGNLGHGHRFYQPSESDERANGFGVIWNKIMNNNIPEHLEFYHTMNCGLCGKELTDPESIACGIGPRCRKYKKKL